MGLRPIQSDENVSVQQPLSMDLPPFPLSSRAKPRDLQFRGPPLEIRNSPSTRIVISTGAHPDFLPRSAGHVRVCGFR
jgi:hypothetical protein